MITFRRWLWQKFKNAVAESVKNIFLIIKFIRSSPLAWGLIIIILSFVPLICCNLIILWLFFYISGIAIMILGHAYEAYKEEVKRVKR